MNQNDDTLPQPSEGEVPFNVSEAGKPCHTFYRVVGDLRLKDSTTKPLVLLHGGPGACHEMLLSFADLHKQYGIPVVFYDQIGNGRSTHLREKAGDESFWNEDLFIKELDNLVDYLGFRTGFDLYGQSWGGMLAARYAVSHPKGLRKLVIADAPGSIELHLQTQEDLRVGLPQEILEPIERCEKEGLTESEEYAKAMEFVRKQHVCRIDPLPEEVQISLRHMADDPTVLRTMWGGHKLKPLGSLRDWTIIPDIPKIQVPTFLLCGRYGHLREKAMKPFFEGISRVRWVTLENSSHLGFWEERERYMELLGDFLVGA